ncbi:MAG: hypothetical protein KIT31_04430 [Deltaproteobacteria bacterium]|nr:hypothetical protein [Deltaproteobacteria bacterium]
MRHHLAWFVAALSATGCPNVKVDPGEGPDDLPTIDGPTVEFDPGNKIIPFPNNLVRTGPGGTVALPAQCNESAASKATRENVINKLDGFGTYQAAMQVTFTEAVDPASLAGKIVVIKRKTGDTVVEPGSAQAIPEAALIVAPGETTRFKPDCSAPETVSSVTIVSALPLEPNSTYVVAVLDGVKTAGGKSFIPSFTWELVRQPELPVVLDDNGNVITNRTPLNPNNEEQLERLRGVNLLWNVHAQALGFLAATGTPRNKTLIAWEFTTQTTTAPLDRAVAGSPASGVTDTKFAAAIPLLTARPINRGNAPFNQCPGGETDLQCFIKTALGAAAGALPAAIYATGDATCAQVGCAAVGNILVGAGGQFKQYQTLSPNAGYDGPGAKMIPGAWGDPRTPTTVSTEGLEVLLSVPAALPPANGYPVIIFQHGLTRSKSDTIAIVSQLSAAGFAVAAIDAAAHGSRAVRVSSDATRGCADAPTNPFGPRADNGPDPSAAPQCYAPFLSPDLGATRDNIRQTVLDLQQLVASVKACGNTQCGNEFKIDASKMFYLGQSLGGIMGGMAVGITADLKGGVLNVPAVGWADILENTASLGIRCSLVDGLIDAGILTGDKLNPQAGTGLCTTDDWKTQPGYRQFAVIGRWVLDSADPANFAAKLATKRVLIQEVVDDLVVPNVATDREAALLRLAPMMASPAVPPVAPSAAITTDPMTNKFVRYPTLPADAGTGFPGNAFAHGSLLAPATGTGPAGSLGVARMQSDAITYLVFNR